MAIMAIIMGAAIITPFVIVSVILAVLKDKRDGRMVQNHTTVTRRSITDTASEEAKKFVEKEIPAWLKSYFPDLISWEMGVTYAGEIQKSKDLLSARVYTAHNGIQVVTFYAAEVSVWYRNHKKTEEETLRNIAKSDEEFVVDKYLSVIKSAVEEGKDIDDCFRAISGHERLNVEIVAKYLSEKIGRNYIAAGKQIKEIGV